MALDFNVGELATRLRRALGVRGRMPLAIDEYVIPTVKTADVTGPPWRTNPVFAQSAYYAEAAQVDRYARIILRHERDLGGEFQNSVFVVTGWQIQPLAYVTATGAAAPFNEAFARFVPDGQSATGTTRLVSTERPSSGGASYVPFQIPVELGAGTSVDTLPNFTDPGILQFNRSGVVQPPVFIPSETLLRPGDTIQFFSSVPSDATHRSALAVSVQGLYYGLG